VGLERLMTQVNETSGFRLMTQIQKTSGFRETHDTIHETSGFKQTHDTSSRDDWV